MRIEPSSKTLGASVCGFDLSAPLCDLAFKEIGSSQEPQ
jgi:hypothetical protein